MIVYDLHCSDCDQDFETWFQSNAAFDAQMHKRQVQCPFCEGHNIGKKLSAPAVSKKANRQRKSLKSKKTISYEQLRKQVKEFNEYVTRHSEDVGDRFASEARKIHYGDIEQKSIIGTAASEEVKELTREGIDIFPLLDLPKKN